jgi:predicted RNA-binding protein
MTKTTTRIYGTADTIRPYVERALTDEKLRAEVMSAFATAQDLYRDLLGRDRTAITVASRVATDEEIQQRLREAMESLRSAADRLQGRREHTARNRALLMTGIALGILFNPVTGPETRRFLREMMFGRPVESFGDDSPDGRP